MLPHFLDNKVLNLEFRLYAHVKTVLAVMTTFCYFRILFLRQLLVRNVNMGRTHSDYGAMAV
jgi:hypothetical protein